jgi:hypothetical protein
VQGDWLKQGLLIYINQFMEASEGIEPPYKDLQSSASPFRHEASRITGEQFTHEAKLIKRQVYFYKNCVFFAKSYFKKI